MAGTTDIENLRKLIITLLDASPNRASQELRDLLSQYWDAMRVEFGTKMAPRKTERIYELRWNPPVLEFRIERHPGAWDRIQRWKYDFVTNEARLLSERGTRQNPRYTKEQVHKDAQWIVEAVHQGSSHPCIEKGGEYYRVWMARLPKTKPVPYELPQRTARGRQARLKKEVARLMEMQPDFERLADQESTGSLVYRYRDTHKGTEKRVEVGGANVGISTPYFRARQKRKGFKKFLIEIIQRSSRSKNPELQNGVHEVRIIDKEQDKYDQIIKDVRTGEVIHEEHEPLSQHKNQPKHLEG